MPPMSMIERHAINRRRRLRERVLQLPRENRVTSQRSTDARSFELPARERNTCAAAKRSTRSRHAVNETVRARQQEACAHVQTFNRLPIALENATEPPEEASVRPLSETAHHPTRPPVTAST